MEEDMVTGALRATQTETEVDLAETEGVHSRLLLKIQGFSLQTIRKWPVLKVQAHYFRSSIAAFALPISTHGNNIMLAKT